MRISCVFGAALALGALTGAARAEQKLTLKGGVGFFTSDLGNVTSAGPAWALIYNFQPIDLFAVELGYEGSRNSLSDPQSPSSTALFRNGGYGLLKVFVPLPPIVHPFVGAGLGVGYVIVQGQSTPAYDSGLIAELPVGAGVEFDLPVVSLGARVTYHYLLTQEFSKDRRPDGPPARSGSLFDIAATVGMSF